MDDFMISSVPDVQCGVCVFAMYFSHTPNVSYKIKKQAWFKKGVKRVTI
jgi:hypothetical protein